MTEIGIMAMDYYLPEEKKSVSDIFKEEDIPFGTLAKGVDFKKDIGIENVRVSGEIPSALALKAAGKVMEKSGVNPDEIDLVVGFSSLPEDYVGPTWSVAGLVQERLGLKNALATAVNTGGCASYHVALKTVRAMMLSNESINTAMMVACDCTPRGNKTYYPITVTSDGGSAIILRKNIDHGVILGVESLSIGRLHDVWYVPGLPYEKPEGAISPTSLFMYCEMEKFNKGVIPVNFYMFKKIIKMTLARIGMKFHEIDFFVYPTFSTWDQRYFMNAMDIPPDKIYLDNLKDVGHVQECDMVVNYVDAASKNRIKTGDNVMVISNGAGFAWSAAVIKH